MSQSKNKLSEELSPYLLQHKNNPVHWYPYTDEAFQKAKAEDKAIFLSIGYSTCHWCHVMEHESFEDEEVARLMNEAFINIKVDREERPDVDHLYMSVCQLMTGQGGWPLTVIMTPDKRPFFAGTYFPKYSRGQQPGMLDLIEYIKNIWDKERDKVLESANQIIVNLIQQNQMNTTMCLTEETLHKAFKQIKESYDEKYGGFGQRPKFPTAHKFNFLLHYHQLFNAEDSLDMTIQTLEKISLGGIYDHIGGGVHRYATDNEWLLPHFEKMLYDQAQLIWSVALAYKITKMPFLKDLIGDIKDYVLTNLTADNGAFYSAEDADTEGQEGKFYVWSIQELDSILTEHEATFVKRTFNLLDEGNFHDEATGQKTGQNIFYLSEQLSKDKQIQWKSIRKILAKNRIKRIKPGLDDKLLTDWNGLMIGALAEAGRLLNDASFIKLAEKAISFIENTMFQDKMLLHRYRNGKVGIHATAYDYTYLIFAFIQLYKATMNQHYLEQAEQLNLKAMELFWDNSIAGFINSNSDDIIVKQKDSYDGALPSVNGMLYYNLLSLSQLLHDPGLYQKAMELNNAFGATINQYPMAYTFWLYAHSIQEAGLPICVVVGKLTKEKESKLSTLLPFNMIIQYVDPVGTDKLSNRLKSKGFVAINKKTTFYLCQNFTCIKPTTEINDIFIQFEK